MLEIILNLFVMIGLGYAASRSGIIDPTHSKGFSRFVFYVSVPAGILALFSSKNVLSSVTLELLALNMIPVFALIALFYALNKILRLEATYACMLVLAAIMPSSLFVGFPLAEVMFGQDGLALATIIAPLHLVFTMLFGIPLIELLLGDRKRGAAGNMLKVAKHPIILSIALGFLLNIWGASLPGFLESPLGTVGSSTTPVALFAMGLFMGGVRLEPGKLGKALVLSLVRLTLYVGLIVLLSQVISVGELALSVSVLLSMMPVAIFNFVLSMEYGLDSKAMALAIILTTLLLPLPVYVATLV